MATASYSTPLVALDAVVLDTETTGLDARSARIIQIGAVKLAGTAITAEVFDRLVNPGVAIPAATTAVHGLKDEDVAGAPRFTDLAPELEAFIGNAIIIGHTISYDVEILGREYGLAKRVWRQPRALDVRMLARLVAPGLASHNLDRLCEWLGIQIDGRHTALGDAKATAEVFAALVPKLRERQIRTLAEAEAASRRLAEQEARTASGFVAPAGPQASDETRALSRIDSFPYRHRVRDVMSSPPVFAPEDATVREALRLLIEKKVSSVYVRDPSGLVGIVTERDALRAVHFDGQQALDQPLFEIMNAPLQTISEDAFVYRAIGRMDRLGFRHLGVRNDHGEVVGAVTTRNLLRHRATTAIMLGDEIDSATTTAALGAAWARLPLMARNLLAEEVDPRTVSAVISSEIRILTRRAAELAEVKMLEDGKGGPPVRYTVLVLGSGGRGESLLAADQDNAIVYETGVEGGPEDQYFEALANHMCRILDEVGVPYCKGGVMAKNRTWRKSLDDWRKTVADWVRRQRPQDLLNVDIFFDSVPVHGDRALGLTLWGEAYDLGGQARDFQKLLTEVARERSPAFTMFGGFKTDETGRIDLKKAGLFPIFTAARVLSIRHGVKARATPDRYRGVHAKGVGSEGDIESVIDAHRDILGAMLNQQLADTEQGIPLTNRVQIDRLDKAGRARLKEALGWVDTAVALVSEGRL